MTQPALFDALAVGHVVTVYDETVLGHVWRGWTCSCGRTSPGAAWSHHELAVQMGQHHADGTT